MLDFDMPAPASLAEAIALLDSDDPGVRPFSGGTALMLMMKTGVFQPSMLVNLSRIEERWAEIAETEDGGLRIGALASLRGIELDPATTRRAPSVVYAMKRLANVRVRNVARIGGNLAHGDPHMDMPPVLASLGASVRVEGPNGERMIAVEDLYSGYYETVLGRAELIKEVLLPDQRGWRSVYKKLTTRSADDWPSVGLAVSLRVTGAAVADVRIAVSAGVEKLTRLTEAEGVLASIEPTETVLAQVAEAAMAAAECVEDIRGTAAYKRELIGVCVRRGVQDAMRQEPVQ